MTGLEADAATGALWGGVIGTFILPAVGTVGGLVVGGLIGHYLGNKNK